MVVQRKLVVAGDDTHGKKCLMITFCRGGCPEVYVPTVFENYVAEVQVDGTCVELAPWTTAGQEGYDLRRPLNYPDSHAVLVCFGIDSPGSLGSVQKKWIPEIRRFCEGIPIILVGCKKDLRSNPHTIEELLRTNQRSVTQEELRKRLAHSGTSNVLPNLEGVRDVFQYAARASLLPPVKRKKSGCIIV